MAVTDYRAQKQAAYVLHIRPYRNTSALVDFFTLEEGKVSAVCQGLRRPNAKKRGVLQPFVPVQIAWQGRNELKTLTAAESTGHNGILTGKALFCAMYINELIHKLLQPFEPHPKLFVYYQYLLNELIKGEMEKPLRVFEHQLLNELGYAVDCRDLNAQTLYFFDPNKLSFHAVSHVDQRNMARYFYGWQAQAIVAEDFTDPQVLRAAKRFMRLRIDAQLDGRQLNSRNLMMRKRSLPVEGEHD
ncbi:MAG: DNA repair protein RecO [Pseudomonadales bacterium]